MTRNHGPSRNGILRIVLTYTTVASLWILLSDKAVEWLFSDPAQFTLASTLKGWLFVAVTSLLLYGLLRRLVGGVTRPYCSGATATRCCTSTNCATARIRR